MNSEIIIPTKAEWEVYKMRRLGESQRVTDYDYVIAPRWIDGRSSEEYLVDIKEMYFRLLETEPFWIPQPVQSWESLMQLFYLEEAAVKQDWENVAIAIDNVIKWSIPDYSGERELNQGVMMTLKKVMKEKIADVQFAGEVFPLYRGQYRTPQRNC